MKIKSAIKDVYFEKWSTPVFSPDQLWLEFVLLTNSKTLFFFSAGSSFKKKMIYLMSVDRKSPYRMIEEGDAYSCIGKYFDQAQPLRRKKKFRQERTWKFWNTDFVKELNEGGLKKKFQYFVRTDDEWIEFISNRAPHWEELPDKNTKAAVRRYIKEECHGGGE